MIAAASGAPAVMDYILPTASLLTVALLTYIARSFRKWRGEHEWLMATTKKNSDEIRENSEQIRKMLEQRERIIDQRDRPVRRAPPRK